VTAAGPPRTLYASTRPQTARAEPVGLVDLLDRLLAGGVVVHGHVTLAVADIDLVDVDIALLVAATATLAGAR
jgi:Gas vesicle protein